ncbi:hypothetical protein [Leptospira haakeii]|uniref:DUF4157 domain-containing protein n=1 Tax=Leptospira haakeii TaxID=2023198 RepID=A0ABX4PFT4_9LEPT|nr:hypothetical protein [Leptospira haakeii]PKA14630.1 hypothetical protein CH363_17880 [Leptospira haakeii]PKA18742.1 hypothetical protein CH377_16415 [Leptospira haakeii]
MQRAFFVNKVRRFAFERSAITAAKIGLSITNPLAGLIVDPAFTTGFCLASIDFTVGTVVKAIQEKPLPSMSYKRGGFIIRNSFVEDIVDKINPKEGEAFAHGPFVYANEGASAATIQHELGHVRQYHSYGGWGEYVRYVSVSPAFENQADRWAGTNSYGNNLAYNIAMWSYLNNSLQGSNDRTFRLYQAFYFFQHFLPHLY